MLRSSWCRPDRRDSSRAAGAALFPDLRAATGSIRCQPRTAPGSAVAARRAWRARRCRSAACALWQVALSSGARCPALGCTQPACFGSRSSRLRTRTTWSRCAGVVSTRRLPRLYPGSSGSGARCPLALLRPLLWLLVPLLAALPSSSRQKRWMACWTFHESVGTCSACFADVARWVGLLLCCCRTVTWIAAIHVTVLGCEHLSCVPAWGLMAHSAPPVLQGAPIQCSHSACFTAYHPLCARLAGVACAAGLLAAALIPPFVSCLVTRGPQIFYLPPPIPQPRPALGNCGGAGAGRC